MSPFSTSQSSSAQYRPRLVDDRVKYLLDNFSAVMITGAHAVGKTTSAVRYAKSVIDLSSPDSADLMHSDPDYLGRILDTFVAQQIRPHLDLLTPPAHLHHVRTSDGSHEIDQLIDLGQGKVIAIEVKAATTTSSRDIRHLIWLRDKLGEKFVRGIIFHTGSHVSQLSDRIWSLPISTLWAS